MKNCLAIVAACLIAAPAMAGEISDGTLSALGLDGMQTITDAQGMQVRGKGEVVVSGTSLVFGQLVADLPTGTNFVVGSDVNHYFATAETGGVDPYAEGASGSGIALSLGPINIGGQEAFSATLMGFAGSTQFTFGGFANALAVP